MRPSCWPGLSIVLLLLAGCGNGAPGHSASGPEVTSGENALACPAAPSGELDTEGTYVLTGAADADGELGARMAVGDLDGDGLDDLVTMGGWHPVFPYVYVVLGATLAACPPGRYPIAALASSTICLSHGGTCSPMGSSRNANYVELHLDDGDLVIAGDYLSGDPLAYLLRWPTLTAAGNVWPHLVADVSDVIFDASPICYGSMGFSLATCDVNGDGERDVLIGGGSCTWGYLAEGPHSTARVDLETEAVRIEYTTVNEDYGPDSAWGPVGLGPCLDYDGDGIDDATALGVNPLSPEEPVVGVYYGHPDAAAGPVFDLGEADVWLKTVPDADGDFANLWAPQGLTGDVDGDGQADLFAGTYAWSEETRTSTLYVFRGGEGFQPSGTTLGLDDRYASVTDPEAYGLLTASTLVAEDGGPPEIVFGRVGNDDEPGTVRLGHLPTEPGDYSVDDIIETTWTGEDAYFGSVVDASGDLDGNGRNDVVAAGDWTDGAPGTVYILLR